MNDEEMTSNLPHFSAPFFFQVEQLATGTSLFRQIVTENSCMHETKSESESLLARMLAAGAQEGRSMRPAVSSALL